MYSTSEPRAMMSLVGNFEAGLINMDEKDQRSMYIPLNFRVIMSPLW